MRAHLTAILGGLVLASGAGALGSTAPPAEKPRTPADQFQTLQKEHRLYEQDFSHAYDKAKTDAEREKLFAERRKRLEEFSRRAVELARGSPEDKAAVEALAWVVTGGLGESPQTAEALGLLAHEHVASDQLTRVCDFGAIFSFLPAEEDFLRAVLKKNPHHEVQGHACLGLARMLSSQAKLARRLKEDPSAAKGWESFKSRDFVKRFQAADPDKLDKEAEALFQRSIDRYADVKYHSRTIADYGKSELFGIRFLGIGKVAPEIEGEDIEGKKFKLSDYRGQVVVLDFWGNW